MSTSTSPGIEPMYTEESLAGFEYEVAPNLALGVKVTRRTIHDVIEDISVDGGQTYFITNPGGTVTVNPVTGEPLEEPAVFPAPTRDYESLEVTLNRGFTGRWQLSASAVYSKNEGNYGGLFRQDKGQLAPNITAVFDVPSALEGAFGPLPNDRALQFKAYGSYRLPIGLTLGGYLQWLDGTPISKLGAHSIAGGGERFVTQRGSAGRTPDVRSLDLHLQYPVRFGSGLELELIADVFNVTDEQSATELDQTWTRARLEGGNLDDCGGTDPDCRDANPLWGTPIAYQSPRAIRLGARLRF